MIEKELKHLYFDGSRVLNSELKRVLQNLYNKYRIKNKAKATDIRLFGFDATRCTILMGDKRKEGLLLEWKSQTF